MAVVSIQPERLPEPVERPWHPVRGGTVLLCPGATHDAGRVRQGRLRCEAPVLRAAVRGVLRWRFALVLDRAPLSLLYTTHRCHACGTVLELDFASHPPRPKGIP